MTSSIATSGGPQEFQDKVTDRIRKSGDNEDLRAPTSRFNQISTDLKYSYDFEWFGQPIIQYPQDICAMQEIIHQTRSDLIIETGIAHGGSLVFDASMSLLLDYEDAVQRGE